MKKTVFMVLLMVSALMLPAFSLAQSREVPFMLDDRDRIIRVEEKLNSQQIQINDLKTSISELKNLFYWGFGCLITIMLFIFGFIVWDRRTLTEPIREKTQSLIQSLREYAKKTT